MSKNRLGQDSAYPESYAPELLHGMARADSRIRFLQGDKLPFHGEDIWNAWELTWLDAGGKPMVATAEIRVPADSTRLIESKSLKLYLNSLAMTRFDSSDAVADLLAGDLGTVADVPVTVSITLVDDTRRQAVRQLPGECIDEFDSDFSFERVDPSFLRVTEGLTRSEELHSHVLRSNCPVTKQPDMGSILIRYRGRPIDRDGAYVAYHADDSGKQARHEITGPLRFLNHNCRPNAELMNFKLVAQRPIRAGTEITVDYGGDACTCRGEKEGIADER